MYEKEIADWKKKVEIEEQEKRIRQEELEKYKAKSVLIDFYEMKLSYVEQEKKEIQKKYEEKLEAIWEGKEVV